jgi:hypothetical protein
MSHAFWRLCYCGRRSMKRIQSIGSDCYWKQWPRHSHSVSSTHPQQKPSISARSSFTSKTLLKQKLNSEPSNAAATSISSPVHTAYKIKEQPLGKSPRKLRVIVISGGISGLNMLIQLKKHIPGVIPIIYEKNAEIDGTWFKDRYPDCASDDLSHSYQFSHTPNPKWSSLFSPAAEIQKYLVEVCKKHNLREEIRCSHSVVRAEWEEDSGT